MNLIGDKIRKMLPILKVLPMFTGVIGSLVFCSLFASRTPVYRSSFTGVQQTPDIIAEAVLEEEKEIQKFFPDEDVETAAILFKAIPENDTDLVLKYYRDPEYREWVTGFFSGLCSNPEIAKAVLENTDIYNVSPALAFALIWEESKFDPRAVNRKNRDGSVDRGLFQLNNRSFPNLDIAAFFDIKTNARYGVSHLQHCLEFGFSDVSALAMYNAGTGRVKNSGTPQTTLDYISRILENQSRIESRFHVLLIKEEESRFIDKSRKPAVVEEHHPQPPSSRILISASPL